MTGDDGASHNGMWDMSVLQVVPGLRLAAPRDATRLRELLNEAVDGRRRPDRGAVPEGPAARRPRGGRPGRRRRRAAAQRHPRRARRRRRRDGVDRGRGGGSGWSPRASASPSSTRAGSSRSTRRLVELARDHGLVVHLEDNGASAAAARCCCRPSTTPASTTPVRLHGIPQEFLDHAKRAVILERVGLDAQTLARGIVEDVTASPRSHRAVGRPSSLSAERADPAVPSCSSVAAGCSALLVTAASATATGVHLLAADAPATAAGSRPGRGLGAGRAAAAGTPRAPPSAHGRRAAFAPDRRRAAARAGQLAVVRLTSAT